jgi:hypothetical protein
MLCSFSKDEVHVLAVSNDVAGSFCEGQTALLHVERSQHKEQALVKHKLVLILDSKLELRDVFVQGFDRKVRVSLGVDAQELLGAHEAGVYYKIVQHDNYLSTKRIKISKDPKGSLESLWSGSA